MKHLILSLLILSTVACTKKADTNARVAATTTSDSTITYTYNPAYAGSTVSVQFNVTLKSADIVKIELYRSPSTLLYDVSNCKPGNYSLYDHIAGSYPTAAQSMFYYFALTNKAGTITTTKSFQVY